MLGNEGTVPENIVPTAQTVLDVEEQVETGEKIETDVEENENKDKKEEDEEDGEESEVVEEE